jgi:hypothetical protein
MDRLAEIALAVLAGLGFVGWLGGGRKWAFRALLSALTLLAVGAIGIFLYGYMTDKAAERRTLKIHECAIAKVAKAQCAPEQRPPRNQTGSAAPLEKYAKDRNATRNQDPYAAIAVPLTCPAYILFDNPTPEQEAAAVAAAEEECTGEIDPKRKSLDEQITQYKREHGIKEEASAVSSSEKSKQDWFDENSPENAAARKKLNPKACADRVRLNNAGAYDDLDDATLTKKVLAKYPTYCDVTSSPPNFIPDIQGVH